MATDNQRAGVDAAAAGRLDAGAAPSPAAGAAGGSGVACSAPAGDRWARVAAGWLLALAGLVNPLTVEWLKGGPIETWAKWAVLLGLACALLAAAWRQVSRRRRAGVAGQASSRGIAVAVPTTLLLATGTLLWVAHDAPRVDLGLLAGAAAAPLPDALVAWVRRPDAVSGERLLQALRGLKDRLVEPDELWDTAWDGSARRRVEELMRGELVSLLDPRDPANPPSVMMPRVDWRSTIGDTFSYALHRQKYLFDLIQAGRESGDGRYLERAKSLALSWIRENPLWLHTLRTNRVFQVRNRWLPHYAWNDDTTSGRVTEHLTLMFALLDRGMLGPEEAVKVLESLVRHARLLARDEFYSAPTNHGLMQARALLLASVVLADLPESREWRRRAIERLERQMRENVSAAGVHRELSVSYHYYVLRAFVYCHLLAERAGIELSPEYERRLRAMLRYAAEILYPDGTAPRLGDTAAEVLSATYNLGRWPKGRYADWEESRVLSAVQSGRALEPSTLRAFWEGSDLLHARHRLGPQASVFDVVMIAPRWRPAHRHFDALSVYLYWRRPLLVGPGYPSGPAALVERAVSTASHNTVTVDGTSHAEGDAAVDPTSVRTSAGGEGCPAMLVARGSHALYADVRVDRELAVAEPGLVLVVDRLAGGRPHTYRQHYNFPSEVELTVAGNEVAVSEPSLGTALRITGWARTEEGGLRAARVERTDGLELTANGFVGAPSVAFRVDAQDATLVSVIQAVGGDAGATAMVGPDSVRVSGAAGVAEVTWGESGLDVRVPGRGACRLGSSSSGPS